MANMNSGSGASDYITGIVGQKRDKKRKAVQYIDEHD